MLDILRSSRGHNEQLDVEGVEKGRAMSSSSCEVSILRHEWVIFEHDELVGSTILL